MVFVEVDRAELIGYFVVPDLIGTFLEARARDFEATSRRPNLALSVYHDRGNKEM